MVCKVEITYQLYLFYSQDIDSILEPTVDEELLLARIMNGLEEEDDAIDPIVDGWKQRIMVERRPIFFEELYKKDVAGRAGEYAEEAEEVENENLPGGTDVPASNAPTTEVPTAEVPATEGGAETASLVKKIVEEAMEKGFKKMYDHVDNLFRNMDSRVKEVEKFVKDKFVKEGRGDGSEDRVGDGDGVGVGVEDVGGLRGETGVGVGVDGDGARGGASEMEVEVQVEEAEGNGAQASVPI
uniref:DUF287 domain-containing protein n=1 Tax=Noccaea caerulescens TaxID=107243 RepID=A0A1J3H083_NOCCA